MVTEQSQEKRLKEYGINIKTKYQVNDSIKERNTDHSLEDNIREGIILEKDYYRSGILLGKETVFDSRILYTYEFQGNDTIVCQNCGMQGKVSEFQNGCPYCHSHYNLDFNHKELGNKYYYDLTVKDKSYLIKTFFIDFVFSFVVVFLYILKTSRTFYFFDVLKIVGGTILVSFLFFYVFYYLDAMILLPSIRRKKEKINEKQKEFFERMAKMNITKSSFYNNLHYDIRNLYYSSKYPDVIDYDIIDYNEYQDEVVDGTLFVTVNLDIRIVRFREGKITSKMENKTYRLKRVKKDKELEGVVNLIQCPQCGASVDATLGKCSYCGSKYNYLQEWYLVDED